MDSRLKTKNDPFYKMMLAIAIPVSFQNMIASALNTIDTVMITRLGEESLAGVGLANQVFFFFFLTCFGINTGGSIFVSQYSGKRDWDNVARSFGFSLFLSALLGTVFTMLTFLFPEGILRLFIDKPEVIRQGAEYLRFVSLSYLWTAISFSFGVAMRSTGDAGTPLKAAILSFVINTGLNYILIFGKLGFPAMGVKGAAIATVVSRGIEMLFIILVSRRYQGALSVPFRKMFQWDRDFVRKIWYRTLPVIINEFFWSLGQVLYAKAYAMLGTHATATMTIAQQIINMFFILVRGLGAACAVVVGNKIGSGDMEVAEDYAKRFLKLSALIGLLMGAIMAFSSGFTIRLFQGVSETVFEWTRKVLLVFGGIFFIKTFNSTMIVGVFRGGGDTKFSMFLEMFAVWAVGVPMAFWGAGILKLPIYYVVMMVAGEDLVKAAIGLPRILSKKWIKDVT